MSNLAHDIVKVKTEDRGVPLLMSVDEARSVAWTFKIDGEIPSEPLGVLLDKSRKTEQDLAWVAYGIAERKGYRVSTRLKEACRTLLADRLMLPVTVTEVYDAGPKVIKGSKYLERQERWSFGEFGFWLGFAYSAVIFLTITLVQELLKGTLTILALIIVGLMLAYISRMLHREAKRSYQEYKDYQKGREGEEAVMERILANLDSQWTVFRNWLWSDRKDDIDIVLVGPGGVWAVEVKTYGEHTKVNTPFSTVSKKPFWRKKKQKWSRTPDQQATDNATRLKRVLHQRNPGIAVTWVEAVVAFPEYKPADFTPEKNTTHIWHWSDIDKKLSQLGGVRGFPQETIQEVIAVLQSNK